jgi:hypothetical protein
LREAQRQIVGWALAQHEIFVGPRPNLQFVTVILAKTGPGDEQLLFICRYRSPYKSIKQNMSISGR